MIEIKDLKKHYGEDGEIKAVDGVSFDCPDGQITGLLGPNGAGKTTTLRMIAALIKPMGGTVIVDGHDVTTDAKKVRSLLGVQSDMLGVYPRLTPREQFRYDGRFYGLKGEALESRVQAVIEELKMEEIADRRAEGFSRGQRQKIVLGRALVHDPHNIIMDEPTSALDVSVQAEILNLLTDLRKQRNLTYLMVTHDLAVVSHLCTDIAVMQLGEIVEILSVDDMRALKTSHPYTSHLLNSSLGRRGDATEAG